MRLGIHLARQAVQLAYEKVESEDVNTANADAFRPQDRQRLVLVFHTALSTLEKHVSMQTVI